MKYPPSKEELAEELRKLAKLTEQEVSWKIANAIEMVAKHMRHACPELDGVALERTYEQGYNAATDDAVAWLRAVPGKGLESGVLIWLERLADRVGSGEHVGAAKEKK